MLEALAAGVILGLTAGLAPGPLLTLVISETLRRGVGAGVKVALAPLITDLPIIIVTMFVLGRLSGVQSVLGVISLVGAAFLLFTGYENLRSTGLSSEPGAEANTSLLKGVLANALNPHPYLFWLSVGGGYLTKAMSSGLVAPALFLGGFYSCLIGSKVLLAVSVGGSRALLRGSLLNYIYKVLGMLLCLLALGMFRDGLALLGFIEKT
ncbi:MAG: LysE family transporter [Proteobacteria bacterium]|nr:LysE family transporter [Pseudomonadota bacterium]